MLRIVLWLAVACAVILAALAVSRGVRFTSEPVKPAEAPAAEDAARPAAAKEPAPQAVTPAPTPEELQVQEDAAAVGLTTVEPEQPSAAPAETAPPKQEPKS